MAASSNYKTDDAEYEDKELFVDFIQPKIPLGTLFVNLRKNVPRTLSVGGFDFSNNVHIIELSKFLFKNPTTKNLNIISFGANSMYLRFFCEKILQSSWCNIESVFFMIYKFVDTDVNKGQNHLCFSNVVSMQPNLKRLTIEIENLNVEYILPLIDTLSNNTSLKTLDIRSFPGEEYNIESGTIIDALTKMLGDNDTLENFSYTYHMDNKDVIKFFEVPGMRIKRLNLYSHIGERHLKKILGLLELGNSPYMISMDIGECDSKKCKKILRRIDDILAENEKKYKLHQPLLKQLIDQL